MFQAKEVASKKIWRQRHRWIWDAESSLALGGTRVQRETDWVSNQIKDGLFCHTEEFRLLLKSKWRSLNAFCRREKWSDLRQLKLFLPNGWKTEWGQMWKSGGKESPHRRLICTPGRGMVRQAGTWDPLPECLHLDEGLLKQENMRNSKGIKIATRRRS